MTIEEVLNKIGLTDREIKVYLSGLKTGPVLATSLAKKTGINRTNLYSILKSLQEKGLVSQGDKSYSKYFIMEDPVRLRESLERKINRDQAIQKELNFILPSLKSFSPTLAITPRIKVFEGKEGIINMLEEIHKQQIKEIQIIQGGKETEEIVGEDIMMELVQKRIERGIRNRALKMKSSIKTLAEDEAELRETRILPPGFNFKTSLIIYRDNATIISSQEEDFGFTIRSQELAQFFKAFFETLWKISKKPQ